MDICSVDNDLRKHLQELEDHEAAYDQDIQVAKELLGIDMEDDGLDSVLLCICKDEKHHIELIGRVFELALQDGGLMDGEMVNAKELVERLVWEDEELIEELAYLALQKPNFASRVSSKCQPEPDAPDDDDRL